jgi:hypothetical protein
MEKYLNLGSHGAPMFVIITYGVFVPTFIILKSKQIKAFARQWFMDAVRNRL